MPPFFTSIVFAKTDVLPAILAKKILTCKKVSGGGARCFLAPNIVYSRRFKSVTVSEYSSFLLAQSVEYVLVHVPHDTLAIV